MKYSLRKVVGIILWWAEGTKSYKDKRTKNTFVHNVDVTNTNPRIITSFLQFLRKDIGIEENRLKLQLQIHQGDDKEELENFWAEVTQIPKTRFNKTIIRPKGNKIGKTKGTCKVRYSDKKTYYKLANLLDKTLDSLNN